MKTLTSMNSQHPDRYRLYFEHAECLLEAIKQDQEHLPVEEIIRETYHPFENN
jgi:hypothetical protein